MDITKPLMMKATARYKIDTELGRLAKQLSLGTVEYTGQATLEFKDFIVAVEVV